MRLIKGKQIEHVIDDSGRSIIVRDSETLDHSEAYHFLIKAYAKFLENDYVPHLTAWDDQRCGMFYIVDAKTEEVLACEIYDKKHVNAKCLWIAFLYVLPKYRRNGYQKIFHQHLIRKAKALGCNRLSAFTQSQNVTELEAVKKSGYDVDTVLMTKWLD